MSMTREDLAWAGGFFSGEGSTTGACQRGKHRVYLSIGQSGDPEVLERFVRCVGISKKVRGPYIHKNPVALPIYRLQYGSFEDVQAIIAKLWPWLSRQKREQAISQFARFHADRQAPA